MAAMMKPALLEFIVKRTGLPADVIERVYNAYPAKDREEEQAMIAEIIAESRHQGISAVTMAKGVLMMAEADGQLTQDCRTPEHTAMLEGVAKAAGTTFAVVCAISNAEFWYAMESEDADVAD